MSEEERRDPIRIQMVDTPPAKQAGWESTANTKRRKKLKEEAVRLAKETNRAFELYGGKTDVKLTIRYVRSQGKADAANIVGGIADALEGVFYENDRQLAQIDYREETKRTRKDSYEIVLERV